MFMLPTVADLLSLDVIRRGSPQVVAGSGGLGARVRWVHVLELADAAHLLQGGELVLTTGVALPADRTAVFGVSASGELALAIGLRHPDLYGAVFCASPGAGYRPPRVMPSPIPRAYLVAGTLEPFFLENATRWAVALARCGCGRCDDGAGRVARRCVLARGVPADGGVGVWTVKHWLYRDGSLPAVGREVQDEQYPAECAWLVSPRQTARKHSLNTW